MTLQDFEREIFPLKDRLYRYVLSMVHREELAKDITQEVFIKVWERRKAMGDIKNKEAWCIRCARNLALDKMKAHANKVLNIEETRMIRDSVLQPYAKLEHSDLIDKMRHLLKNLPTKQREIFQLRELAGFSNQEIQEILGLEAGQVKTNLFRARKKIRESIKRLVNYGLQEN